MKMDWPDVVGYQSSQGRNGFAIFKGKGTRQFADNIVEDICQLNDCNFGRRFAATTQVPKVGKCRSYLSLSLNKLHQSSQGSNGFAVFKGKGTRQFADNIVEDICQLNDCNFGRRFAATTQVPKVGKCRSYLSLSLNMLHIWHVCQ